MFEFTLCEKPRFVKESHSFDLLYFYKFVTIFVTKIADYTLNERKHLIEDDIELCLLILAFYLKI